jgi:2-oxoisovalerate dehydrogenase E1 component
VLANIRGIKVVYPSNGADLKGLLKSAFYDPNPVVVLEHKGLYWYKIPGTEAAKVIEPDAAYRVPIGKGRMVTEVPAGEESTCTIITYGRGVYWSQAAAADFAGRVEILDLRTISPVDFELIAERIQHTHRAVVVTEEPVNNGFAQAMAGRISSELFADLDAPVQVVGSMETPAIPLNENLERFVLVNEMKVRNALEQTLEY